MLVRYSSSYSTFRKSWLFSSFKSSMRLSKLFAMRSSSCSTSVCCSAVSVNLPSEKIAYNTTQSLLRTIKLFLQQHACPSFLLQLQCQLFHRVFVFWPVHQTHSLVCVSRTLTIKGMYVKCTKRSGHFIIFALFVTCQRLAHSKAGATLGKSGQ